MLILFELLEELKLLAGKILANLAPKLLYHFVLSLTLTTPQTRLFLQTTLGLEK